MTTHTTPALPSAASTVEAEWGIVDTAGRVWTAPAGTPLFVVESTAFALGWSVVLRRPATRALEGSHHAGGER